MNEDRYNAWIKGCRKGDNSILVVGLGLTGFESALALTRLKNRVIISEKTSRAQFLSSSRFADRLSELEMLGITVCFDQTGPLSSSFLSQVNGVVVSPGVPLTSPLIKSVVDAGIIIISEFELGLLLLDLPSICVTGSNGKSTTCTLIHGLLNDCGTRAVIAGNVGIPVISYVTPSINQEPAEIIVVEGSSYQLELTHLYHPTVSVFLNLSENHLERHGDMETYFKAKAGVSDRQNASQFLVYNDDDIWAKKVAATTKAVKVPFGKGSYEVGVEIEGNQRDDALITVKGKSSFQVRGDTLSMRGYHAIENVAASLAALIPFHLPVAPQIKRVQSFRGIPHRVEVIGEVDSVLWINDAKSTTPASTRAAIETVAQEFSDRRILLLVGGVLKEGTWSPVVDIINQYYVHIAGVFCFGEGGPVLADRFKEGLQECIPIEQYQNLGFAVQAAAQYKNCVVLLSPGGTSFDEFKSFEERGEAFKRFVHSGFSSLPCREAS